MIIWILLGMAMLAWGTLEIAGRFYAIHVRLTMSLKEAYVDRIPDMLVKQAI